MLLTCLAPLAWADDIDIGDEGLHLIDRSQSTPDVANRCDPDGDGFPSNVEGLCGSDPDDEDSTPENVMDPWGYYRADHVFEVLSGGGETPPRTMSVDAVWGLMHDLSEVNVLCIEFYLWTGITEQSNEINSWVSWYLNDQEEIDEILGEGEEHMELHLYGDHQDQSQTPVPLTHWMYALKITYWDDTYDKYYGFDPVPHPTVAKLQWNDDGTWTDVAGTMYVTQGTEVEFRAVASPPGASWPEDQPEWSGSSGVSGTGPSKTVTFNTLSSDLTDYKTVIAECCGEVTANVVVYTLWSVPVPVDFFEMRYGNVYGLEEMVHLAASTYPSDIPVNWGWTSSGVGEVLAPDSPDTYYDAMHVAGAATLKLKVKTGPSKGQGPEFPRTIIEPSGVRMTRVDPNRVWHLQGVASAGIALYYWLDTKWVSFDYLKFGEGSCPATNSGFFESYLPFQPGPPPINSHPNG